MKVLINDDIPLAPWESLVSRCRHSTPFQSPDFFRAFRSGEYFGTRAFAVSEDDLLKALAVVTVQMEKGIAGFFSARAIIYGGPLVEDDCPQALEMLLDAVYSHLKRGVIYFETRNLSDFSRYRDIFISSGYKYNPYLNFMIDTRDMDKMKRRVSSSRMRQIRKAVEKSVICAEAENLDEVLIFYGILKDLYQKKLHKPLPPEDFFIAFYKENLGKYLLVKHDDRIIGGIMCPVLARKGLYEFYICGMDDTCRDLYPSIMATWGALEFAVSNNIPLFDFMGAGRPGENYGVRDFKARFGGELVEYGRFIRISKPVLFQLGKAVLSLKKLAG